MRKLGLYSLLLIAAALVAGPAVPPAAAAGAEESDSTVADSMVPTPARYAGDAGTAGAVALSTGRLPSTVGRLAAGSSREGAAHAATSAESVTVQRTVPEFMPAGCSLRAEVAESAGSLVLKCP